MSDRKINVIEVKRGEFGAAMPASRPDELQIVFVDADTNTQHVLCVPRGWRMDLAMTLLGADGARANVSLTYPKPPKEKRDAKAPRVDSMKLSGGPAHRRKRDA